MGFALSENINVIQSTPQVRIVKWVMLLMIASTARLHGNQERREVLCIHRTLPILFYCFHLFWIEVPAAMTGMHPRVSLGFLRPRAGTLPLRFAEVRVP